MTTCHQKYLYNSAADVFYPLSSPICNDISSIVIYKNNENKSTYYIYMNILTYIYSNNHSGCITYFSACVDIFY